MSGFETDEYEPDGAEFGGGGWLLPAILQKNGLMGANELGTCHHNAERALVHPGARVPMQQESEVEG